MIALVVGAVLALLGAVLQVVGFRAGLYKAGSSIRDRLLVAFAASACLLCAALLFMIGGFQTLL